MKFFKIGMTFFLMWALFLSCTKKDKTTLCGTWKMIEGNYKGPDFSVVTTEENRICYKILSQNHFSVVEMFTQNPDSQFFAAVGTYTLSDTTYTEHYEASNLPSKTGETLTFHSIVKDNKWTISLKANDLELHETWICVNSLPTDRTDL